MPSFLFWIKILQHAQKQPLMNLTEAYAPSHKLFTSFNMKLFIFPLILLYIPIFFIHSSFPPLFLTSFRSILFPYNHF